ncbi:MAG: L-aspartate oxidase, partial [Gammaproteobacteria bacterium]
MTHQYQHDVLVIGSGASGLSLALQLAEHASVAVLSKSVLSEGATFYAQGGVSAVLDTCDSIDSHVQDTLHTGAGLCNEDIVRFVVEHGRESIQWLTDLGVNFTKVVDADGGVDFHLHKEGGHSHRRIIHASDSTGRAIETTLENRVREHSNIELFEYRTAIDLITSEKSGQSLPVNRCLGAYVYNEDESAVEVFKAKFVILATGGVGKVYLYTSNPDICTGDGIAMAWRAG